MVFSLEFSFWALGRTCAGCSSRQAFDLYSLDPPYSVLDPDLELGLHHSVSGEEGGARIVLHIPLWLDLHDGALKEFILEPTEGIVACVRGLDGFLNVFAFTN